jgi:hypothetical protein
VDGAVTDFFPTVRTVTGSGWHTMRIEGRDNQITHLLDGALLVQINDSTFPCGVCGVGYSQHTAPSYPAARGACFDNFVADTLETNLPPQFTGITNLGSGQFGLGLKGRTGTSFTIYASTNLVDWSALGTVPSPTGAVQFTDSAATNAQRYYRSSQP